MFCVSSSRCHVFVLTFRIMLTCFFSYVSLLVCVLMSPPQVDMLKSVKLHILSMGTYGYPLRLFVTVGHNTYK